MNSVEVKLNWIRDHTLSINVEEENIDCLNVLNEVKLLCFGTI